MTDLDEALYQLLSRLEAAWLPEEQPGDGIHHAYDPLPVAIFRCGLAVVVEHAPGRRFLDIGCGIGTKLALMHYLGWEVAGLDRYAPYVTQARSLAPEATTSVSDAFDVSDFTAWDVVYAYRPMRGDDDELALERHLLTHMRPGALLWLPARALPHPLPAERISGDVWRV